ncbi:helix-turn-helix domain-containing protein [Methylobacterium sp. WL30]|nr:helix-turn-helix domain-containing protein [Methylobacterium sp. WL93]TXN45352.1 helix-turn-helix domain-containing protein [Methylobacterium sp. WL119]TXN63516.1 helix-turn-helix domain-containing protein [Methylobacterium sp. WL30]
MRAGEPMNDTVPRSLTQEPGAGASDADLGIRIRFMRGQRKMTLDGLAEATGLTKSYLSKVERQQAVPSITTVLKVSQAFGVSVGDLLGETIKQDAICLVRNGEGTPFLKEGGGDFNYRAIASSRTQKAMQPFVIRPPKEFQSPASFTHAGEEYLFVLSGQIEIEFKDRVVRMDVGDSVYFDSMIPHRVRSLGQSVAEALVVVTNAD